MKHFVPYEKLSKKERRKLDQARRQTWGALNPVTRKPETTRAYNRNKIRSLTREIPWKTADFLRQLSEFTHVFSCPFRHFML